VAAGAYHTCGLTADGEAYCWGYNGEGELGQVPVRGSDGSVQAALSPQSVSGGMSFRSIVASGPATCALGAAIPTVTYCWGSYSMNGPVNTPVALSGAPTFASLFGVGSGICGLTDVGKAWCWGANSYGQLGDGTTTWASTPVAAAPSLTFSTLSVGYSEHTCGVTTAGPTYCWGANWYGQLGNGTTSDSSTSPLLVQGNLTFTRLTSGDGHTCGLTTTGAAYCWGRNEKGQVGDGGYNTSSIPVKVTGDLTFKSITSGALYTCGVTTTNGAFCWGANTDGQLGDGTTTNRRNPVWIAGAAFTSLSAGAEHTCGLTIAGLEMCWGNNEAGKLGDGTTGSGSANPVAVSTDVKFGSIYAGDRHTCGISLALATYCWGWNGDGQLGDGTATNRSQPVAVGAGLGLTSLALGGQHTCGLSAGGAAYCWGWNGNGQLGDDPWGYTLPNTVVTVSGGQKFTRLVAGFLHTCGLTVSQVAWCWGSNQFGESGRPRGNSSVRVAPGPVSGSLTFISLAVGRNHTCGITSSKEAYCWGANGSGQLGDGTTGYANNRDVPTRVVTTDPLKFTSIVAGEGHTCAIADSGVAWCWGRRYSVGDGGYTDRPTPVPVSGTTHYDRLIAGGWHTCGWTSGASSSAECWGMITIHEGYRTSSLTSNPTPKASANHTAVVSAAFGLMHDCGLDATGTATCWGNRRYGQLGDGTVRYTSVPVLVAGQIEPWVPGTAPTLSLTTGWNHVAIGTYQATTLTAEDVCQAINTANGAGTAAEIDRWVNGGWEGHICGLPPNGFTLDRYTGYFLKLTRPATWTPPA
jgi:alpha-tubulin suppressor-like RCC1 family protein